MAIAAIFAVVAVAAAGGVGFLLGYYGSRPEAEATGLKEECNKFRSDIEALSTKLTDTMASLSAAREENADLAERVAGLTRHYLDQTNRMREVEQQRGTAEMHASELEAEVARLQEKESHLTAKVTEQAVQLLDIQKKRGGLSILQQDSDEGPRSKMTFDGLKEAQVN